MTLAALAGQMAQDPQTRDAGTSLAKGDYKQAADQLRQLGQQMDQMSPAEQQRLAAARRLNAASRQSVPLKTWADARLATCG